MSSSQTSASVKDAAIALGSLLSSEKYALVGGAACMLLGSLRATRDVDIVVPSGKTIEIRKKFRESKEFTVEARTAHTYYQSSVPVEIEILTPPVLFQEKFDVDTPTVTIHGIHILKPAYILNAKCKSIFGRSTDDKKMTDAADIQFLLGYIARSGTKLDPSEVPAASKAFIDWFVSNFDFMDLWVAVGYDVTKDWYISVYQANACDDPWSIIRFSACRVLKEGGIPCYVWSEDALSYYGVPTELFDLSIIVDDVEKATELLITNGWRLPSPDFLTRYNDIEELTRYLLEPRATESYHSNEQTPHAVIKLLAASDWNIALRDVSTDESAARNFGRWPFIPLLHDLIDSLIERWLDSPDRYPHFRMYLAIYLSYLYRYVPILKTPEFAQYLRTEHRQYHHDVISGMSVFGDKFRRHERQARDAIKRREDTTFAEPLVNSF